MFKVWALQDAGVWSRVDGCVAVEILVVGASWVWFRGLIQPRILLSGVVVFGGRV